MERQKIRRFLNLLQFALPFRNGKHPQERLYNHILYDFYRAGIFPPFHDQERGLLSDLESSLIEMTVCRQSWVSKGTF